MLTTCAPELRKTKTELDTETVSDSPHNSRRQNPPPSTTACRGSSSTRSGQSAGVKSHMPHSSPLGTFGAGSESATQWMLPQDIYIRKQHLELPMPAPELGFVIQCIERPGPVEVDSGVGMHTTHGHQFEGRLLRWLATLQRIVQRTGNEGAHTDAAGCSCLTHLLCKLVIKRDCRSHDALS